MRFKHIICLAALSLIGTSDAGELGPTSPLVIPITQVIGGTGVANNAKTNPNGGYFSIHDSIEEFKYPNTHGNQLGKTAMVNDHTYWDSSPGGLDATHAPHADPGGGKALWWPVPTEWAAYEVNVAVLDTYTVLTRFSTSWGPGKPVIIHMEIDGVSSGPITLKPDDPELWKDRKYLVAGWWGHTMVSSTSPMGWPLAPGRHVLKVFIDSFPDHPKDHGNLWIHYFKIVKGGTPIAMPAPKSEVKKIEPVVTQEVAPKKIEACDYSPLEINNALSVLKVNIAEAAKTGEKIAVWIPVFGQRQKVELSAADEKEVAVKVNNNLFSQSWDKLGREDIADVARSCIQQDSRRALALADYYFATGQANKASEALTQAAQLDTKLGKPLSDRMKYLDALVSAK